MTGRQLAVVTGAARGVGRAVCERLADADYAVIGLDRAERPSHARCSEFIRCDVTDLEQLDRSLRDVLKTRDRLSVAISNAGALEQGPLESCDTAEIRRCVDLNLTAPIVLARACAPRMTASGLILFVSSISGERGSIDAPVYAAAKSGLRGLTAGLARRYGPRGVRVLALEAGSIENTGLNVSTGEDISFERKAALKLQLKKRIPSRRLLTPGDIADWVLFLASQDRSANGAALRVDGGELWSA